MKTETEFNFKPLIGILCGCSLLFGLFYIANQCAEPQNTTLIKLIAIKEAAKDNFDSGLHNSNCSGWSNAKNKNDQIQDYYGNLLQNKI